MTDDRKKPRQISRTELVDALAHRFETLCEGMGDDEDFTDEQQLAYEAYSAVNSDSLTISDLRAELAAIAERDRWIPVSERLPGIGQQVVAWWSSDDNGNVSTGDCTWNGADWYEYAGSSISYRPPTHWREMPEGPK